MGNPEETAPPTGQSTATTQTVPPPNSRSTNDYDDSDKTGPNFTDHFSLRHPPSTVRFRGARVHVYEAGNEQILLEDHRSSRDVVGNDDDNGKSRRQHRHTITVKRMDWSGFGLRTLRLAYALIVLLLVGFAFVLCFQIVLFLFLNLPIDANASSIEARRGRVRIVGTLLSVPVFLFGMASLMAIGTTFVSDCWQGGPLIRAVSGLPSLVTEVLFFVFFILVPALTAVVTLMAQYENPWEVTCRAWCLSVAFVFCMFGLGVVYREVQACFQLVSLYFDNNISVEDQATMPTWKRWLLKIRRATLLTTMQRYSGHKNEQYLVTGEDVAPEGGFTFSDKHKPRQSKRGLYTRFTQMKCLGCIFDAMDPPKRLYTVEEVRDLLPFVTRHNWSLESMFCRKNRERGIVSAKGPSALTLDQVKASVMCNIGATTLVSLIVIAFLVWFNSGVIFYIVGAIICVLCCIWPLVRSSAETMAMYKDINTEQGIDEALLDDEEAFVDEAAGKDDASAGDGKEPNAHAEHHEEKRTMFQLWETTRVAQPKEWTCYSLLSFEFFFFFAWPMCVLFITKNYPVAVVFLLVSIVAMFRKFFDPSAILCELGSMNDIDIETNPGEGELYKITGRTKSLKGADKTLVLKARLADIVGNISRSAATTRWMWFFGTLVLLIFLLFLQAINSDDGLGERPPIVLVNDFYYPGEPTLQYPTCRLSKGFKIGDSDTALGDYSMLSALAYETTNVTDYLLPQYFGGEGVAIDEDEFVANYRDDSGTASVPVYFKFITFPGVPDLGVVAIRGSQTSWDWVVNMQLWSAAGLAQAVKWGIPYGWLWHPILDELVSFVDFIQNENIKRVSYYTVTSGFINDVLDGYGGSNFTTLRVTGASLGGGLAIITGAQTGAPAVAISGLGAELSRHTLDPPVTMAQINENVFNFIPDRDYIARIGGRPRQHQEAQCQASTSSLFGCHSMWRSVCEIAYRCGSNGRPVPCRCVQRFGYPEPLPLGTTNRTFLQACEEEEEAFLNATGSTVTSGYFD